MAGFGQSGPYSKRGGYDVIAAAMGGLMHITGPKVHIIIMPSHTSEEITLIKMFGNAQLIDKHHAVAKKYLRVKKKHFEIIAFFSKIRHY